MAPLSATDRLRRLLAMVPWIVEHDGPTIEEISARFSVDPAELTTDLETLFMVGLHPFTPDELIEVSIDDGRVWVKYADYFERPLRLTPTQSLALLAAGETLRSIEGADTGGPLERGLQKLAAVVEHHSPSAVGIELDSADTETLETLRQALNEQRAVELDYYSFARDDRSVRMVDPWHLEFQGGHWYLSGWSHDSEAERLFRVDRMNGATITDQEISTSPSQIAVGEFSSTPEHGTVRLELAPAARWVLSAYPCEVVTELDDGGVAVELVYSGTAWLERLLLRLGSDAVIDGEEHRQLATAAAARILERYQ
jgi:proteasome accessory factor C